MACMVRSLNPGGRGLARQVYIDYDVIIMKSAKLAAYVTFGQLCAIAISLASGHLAGIDSPMTSHRLGSSRVLMTVGLPWDGRHASQ